MTAKITSAAASSRCVIWSTCGPVCPKNVVPHPGTSGHARPAPLELTYAPAHIAANAHPAATSSESVERRIANAGAARRGSYTKTINARDTSVVSNSIAVPQWNITESGLFARKIVAPPSSTWSTNTTASAIVMPPKAGITGRRRWPMMTIAATTNVSTNASTRCVHSSTTPPCNTGTTAPWQRGQSGHVIPAALMRVQLPSIAKP